MYGVPQDIVDLIIDQLFNDKRALKACTLVHSSWLNSARLHLFRCIEPVGRTPQEAIFAWSAFLGSYPAIGSCVRTLFLAPQGLPDFSLDLLLYLLVSLPRLHALHLIRVRLERSATDWAPMLFPLRSLSLIDVHLRSVKPLQRLLSLFPHIDKLDLSEVHLPESERPTPKSCFRRIPITSLTASPSDATLSIVRSMLDIRHLSSFRMSFASVVAREFKLPEVGRIVRSVAATLTHLEIDVESLVLTPSTSIDLDVSPCHALKSIVLCLWLHDPGIPLISATSSDTFSVALDILGKLSPKAPVISVTFIMTFYDNDNVHKLPGEMDWEKLKAMLRKFDKLESIRFETSGLQISTQRRIEQELQEWKENGSLSFSWRI